MCIYASKKEAEIFLFPIVLVMSRWFFVMLLGACFLSCRIVAESAWGGWVAQATRLTA
jgi:hypothetical protein